MRPTILTESEVGQPLSWRIGYLSRFSFSQMGAAMGLGEADASESRFVAYVDGVASVIGHKDRIGPLRDYCRGLMLPCERKSVEPMAGGDGTFAHLGAAPIVAAFCRRRPLVGRHGVGQGARAGFAGDRTAGSDRSMDYR